MAREFARVKVGIWADPAFRRLSPPAQHLYFTLLTAPSLTHCGVADWRPKRIAALSDGWGEDSVYGAAYVLAEQLYIVVDEDTEEVLVRSFIRHDGLMHQPRMAVSMVKAQHAVASAKLRGVIVHELRRLKDEEPDLPGWKDVKGRDGQALELLKMEAIDPSTLGVGLDPAWGSVSAPFGSNAEQGLGHVWGSPTPAPIPPAPTPADSSAAFVNGDAPDKPKRTDRKRPATPLPKDWQPTDSHLAKVKELNLDGPRELEKFKAHAEANDRRQVNWNAAFTQWLLNSKPSNVRSITTPIPPGDEWMYNR